MPHTRYQSPFEIAEGTDMLIPEAPVLAGPVAPQLPMPAAMRPPQLPPPSFAPHVQPPETGKGRQIAMLIPALLAGLRDPASIGAALRGISKARDRKMAAYENELQRQERKSREAAEFYGRAMENANGIEDEAEFERWRQMIAPSADLLGIDPQAFTFNANRATQKKRTSLVAHLEAIEKRDPSLAQRDDFSVSSPDYPEPVHVSIVRGWRAEPVDASGKRIIPPVASTFKSDTTTELKLNAYARSRGVRVEELTPEQIDDAIGDDSAGAAVEREMLLDGKRALVFVDRQSRKVFDAAGNDVTTRVRPLSDAPTTGERTADRRERQERLRGRLRLALRNPASYDLAALQRDIQAAGLDFDVERDDVARQIERDAIARARTVDLLPVDGTDGVPTADALLSTFDAEVRRQTSTPAPARGRGAGPGPAQSSKPAAGRTATKADVEAVAKRMGVTYEDAKRHFESLGVRVQ